MHSLLDEFLVGGALLASIVYALLALGPRTLKRALLVRMAAWVRSAAAIPGLRVLARRLETAAAGKPSGTCGGCEDCGSGQSKGSEAPAAEISVPMSKIGRR